MSQENVEICSNARSQPYNRRDVEALPGRSRPRYRVARLFGLMFGGEATVSQGPRGHPRIVRTWTRFLRTRLVAALDFRELGRPDRPSCSRPGPRQRQLVEDSVSPYRRSSVPTSRTASASGPGLTSTAKRPSKPPGSRSRRCRRRTSRSRGSDRGFAGATSSPGWIPSPDVGWGSPADYVGFRDVYRGRTGPEAWLEEFARGLRVELCDQFEHDRRRAD